MKDLTEGSIVGHILAMAAPMAIGLIVQTLYFMVDLYLVAKQGGAALAGVGAAGNFTIAVMALTQVLSVGTVTVVAHAVGAKTGGQPRLQPVVSARSAMRTGRSCGSVWPVRPLYAHARR